jgi:hypothetical protein
MSSNAIGRDSDDIGDAGIRLESGAGCHRHS